MTSTPISLHDPVRTYGSMEGFASSQPGSSIDKKTNSASEVLLAKPEFRFAEMSKEQRKSYAKAMVCRATKKGIQTLEGIARGSLASLSGVQLSGILNSKTATTVDNYVWLSASCTGTQPIVWSNQTEVDAPPQSLKQMIDKLLIISIDNMTYASAGAWFLANTCAPRIERYFATKEDAYMRQVIERQNGEEGSPSKIVKSTTASKISSLIEYAMPVLFDGTRTAIFLRFLKHIGDKLTFPSSTAPITASVGNEDCAINLFYEIVDATIGMLPGEDPVSDPTLYILLAAGIVLYATQAWCNFHHDLQTKKNESDSAFVEEIP